MAEDTDDADGVVAVTDSWDRRGGTVAIVDVGCRNGWRWLGSATPGDIRAPLHVPSSVPPNGRHDDADCGSRAVDDDEDERMDRLDGLPHLVCVCFLTS